MRRRAHDCEHKPCAQYVTGLDIDMLRVDFLCCIWQEVCIWLESGMHFFPASLGRDRTARTANNVLKGCCWPCRSWMLLQRRWPAMTTTALLRRLSDLFCHEGGTCRWGRQRKAAEPVAYEPIIWVVFACSSSIHPWFSACSMCEVVRYWVP